jgi:hypothetical protein
MKPITQKEIKNQLIKIIRKQKIVDVMYEPRYELGYENMKVEVGGTLTIRTSDL